MSWIDILLGKMPQSGPWRSRSVIAGDAKKWDADNPEENERRQRTREKMRARLEAGDLEERMIELSVDQKAVPVQIFSNMGMEQMDVEFQNIFERIIPKQAQQRQVPLRD